MKKASLVINDKDLSTVFPGRLRRLLLCEEDEVSDAVAYLILFTPDEARSAEGMPV